MELQERVTCECGKSVRSTIYKKHLKTKQHLYDIRPKQTDMNYKLEKYNENKDVNNCCSRCLKVDIPPCYFLPISKLCICCDEILKGGEKTCRICKHSIPVELMERPYLYYCKKCAAERTARPIQCECGMTISLSVKSKHVRSIKHRKNLDLMKTSV